MFYQSMRPSSAPCWLVTQYWYCSGTKIRYCANTINIRRSFLLSILAILGVAVNARICMARQHISVLLFAWMVTYNSGDIQVALEKMFDPLLQPEQTSSNKLINELSFVSTNLARSALRCRINYPKTLDINSRHFRLTTCSLLPSIKYSCQRKNGGETGLHLKIRKNIPLL